MDGATHSLRWPESRRSGDHLAPLYQRYGRERIS
jgi:hypothetical protein